LPVREVAPELIEDGGHVVIAAPRGPVERGQLGPKLRAAALAFLWNRPDWCAV